MLLRAGTPAPTPPPTTSRCCGRRCAQLPGVNASARSVGRKVLVRIDGAGCSHAVLDYLHARRLGYSVGFTLPDTTPELLERIPASRGPTPTTPRAEVREGAMVAELTGLLDLTGWPPGMRVIVRKERPAPRRAAADHRRQRVAGHRVRDQHPGRRSGQPVARAGAAAPAPRPGRGPDPMHERRRAAQPAPARLPRQPDLARGRRPRRAT